jgi:hypothetical protein
MIKMRLYLQNLSTKRTTYVWEGKRERKTITLFEHSLLDNSLLIHDSSTVRLDLGFVVYRFILFSFSHLLLYISSSPKSFFWAISLLFFYLHLLYSFGPSFWLGFMCFIYHFDFFLYLFPLFQSKFLFIHFTPFR